MTGWGVRGREEWTLTAAEDGTRTLRAHCRMFDTDIERDVVHTASAGFRPLRSFVSHRVGGAFLGEGWFVFGEDTLESELLLRDEGRVSQRVPLTGPPPFFVPHAVCCDAWIVPAYDLASRRPAAADGRVPLLAPPQRGDRAVRGRTGRPHRHPGRRGDDHRARRHLPHPALPADQRRRGRGTPVDEHGRGLAADPPPLRPPVLLLRAGGAARRRVIRRPGAVPGRAG
ncbi:hypothetical protein ACFSTC_42960 [Nonomuraea ferruginea]